MPADELDDLDELWQLAKPALLERCANVGRAAATGAEADVFTAHADAHKLAGAVGMFGKVVASDLAIRLERLVRDGALDEPARRGEVTELVAELSAAVSADR